MELVATESSTDHDSPPDFADLCQGKHGSIACPDVCLGPTVIVCSDVILLLYVDFLKDHAQNLRWQPAKM